MHFFIVDAWPERDGCAGRRSYSLPPNGRIGCMSSKFFLLIPAASTWGSYQRSSIGTYCDGARRHPGPRAGAQPRFSRQLQRSSLLPTGYGIVESHGWTPALRFAPAGVTQRENRAAISMSHKPEPLVSQEDRVLVSPPRTAIRGSGRQGGACGDHRAHRRFPLSPLAGRGWVRGPLARQRKRWAKPGKDPSG